MSVVWVFAACLAAGALIGFTGGMLGIGGGLIAIPALSLILGMDQQLAQGTAIIMVLPAIILTVRKYNQHARIDFRAAMAGAVTCIMASWGGAHLALGLDPVTLRRGFAIFLAIIGVFYVWQTCRPALAQAAVPDRPGRHLGPRQAAVLGVFAGVLGGFFGVGGGVLAVPLMTSIYGLSQRAAQGFALSMIIPGTAIALGTYAWAGQADWSVGVPLAMGSLLFVPQGVKLAYRLPEIMLRRLFAVMLFATVGLLFVV